WDEWTPYADAGGRLSFGGIQFLAERSMLVYGESIILLPMLDDLTRPLSLACQLINPLRLRTPTDLQNQDNIIDGVEIGEHGEIVALWIKKSGPASGYSTSNTSENYLRLPIKQGHRWNVLYRFDAKDPEQVNGYPILTPAMKKFKDLNDFLDSELVSSIVTAAFSLFVQVPEGIDPSVYASVFAGIEESGMNPDGSTKIDRFQELDPGAIMYGNPGEKPFPIAANRPGTTFEPFIKIIRQAIAQAVGLPYVIAFKDVDSANFAGFRSAMLDAWKLFLFRRNNAGLEAQKIYTMVQEEGFLRGRIKVKNFYLNIHALTKCDWRGAPKGDIEPVKAIQADILAIDAKLKTRAEAITERTNAGDWRTTFAQLADEEEVLKEQGISDAPEQKTEIQKDDNQEEQDPGEEPGQSNPDK
ncbi:MAG: phage portal protein, partial [bacterium]|nr:phage portal protein [bacterium]